MTITRTHKLIARYCLVILWMGLIFWFSAHNASESSRQSGAVLRQLQEHGATGLTMHEVRKAAHFGLYMVLGVLLYNLIRSYAVAVWRAGLLALLCAALYATTDELHQLFITGRSSELRDVGIDTCGALTGVLLWYGIMRLARQNGPSQKDRMANDRS